MEITGKVKYIGLLQQWTDTFRKQTIIIETTETGANGIAYDQCFEVQFTQDKIQKIAGLRVGDNITVTYNLRGTREPKQDKDGNYRAYTTLDGWKVEKEQNVQQAQPQQMPQPEMTDGLPF